MTDKHATVYRSTNPIEAEIMEDLLGQEGMEPRLLGTRTSALLGVTDNIMSLRIEVPQPLEQQAKELVQAILASPEFASHPEDLDDERDDGFKEEANEQTGPAQFKHHVGEKNNMIVAPEMVDGDENDPVPKKRYITFGIAFLFPGLAHFYLGRYWTGFLLLMYAFTGYASFLSGKQYGAVLFLGVPLCDILFTQSTFPKPGAPPYSTGQQFMSGILIGAALFAVMATIGG